MRVLIKQAYRFPFHIFDQIHKKLSCIYLCISKQRMNAKDLNNQNQKSIFQKFLDNYRLHIGILGIFWMCIDRGINLSKDYRIASYKDIH